MATSKKKSTTKTTVHQYVSTKPTTSLPDYNRQVYKSQDYNDDMPYSYKAQKVTANQYNGPAYQAQNYTSGYKGQNYQSSFNPTEFKDNYNAQNYVSNYKPSTFNEQFNAQNYVSNYKPTEFTDAYNPGQYQSQYMPQIESALNGVTNFQYDPMQDASYQALAKVYGMRGNLAAKSTLADAASLNGGYGTSNAVSAAQQARNQYNQELAGYIPQLEQAAYQRAQGNLAALQDMDNTLYGRFSDDQSRQLQGKQFGLDVARYNEGNQQFAEQNAQNVHSMNRDDAYRAYQASLDRFNTNEAIQQFAELNAQNVHSMNRDDAYRAYQAGLDAFNANQSVEH